MPNPIIEKVRVDNLAEVLQAAINTEEQLNVLKSWENEAHQLQVAMEENMTGGEPSRLDEIRKAIDRIEKEMVVP